MKHYSKESIVALFSNAAFLVILGMIAVLGIIENQAIQNQLPLDYELRALFSLIILVLASLHIEDNFWLWAVAASFPNLAIVFFGAIYTSQPGVFLKVLFCQIVVVIAAVAFHKKLFSSFMSEVSFKKLKEEAGEGRQKNLQRILMFSLIGCLKERSRVISQAYHVLTEVFKVDRAVIFYADYEKNMLCPYDFTGNSHARGIQPLLVKSDFWTKNACDPEKGVLNVISGSSRLPSLRQLIPGANLDAIAVMPLSAEGRVIGMLAIIKQKDDNRYALEPELFITFANVLASALENCSIHEKRISQLDTANKKAQQIEASFGKYVSPTIVKELVQGESLAELGGKKRSISVMIVDLRGFTRLTSVMRLEYLVQMLNGWFEEASSLILRNHGTIDKYMGDGIMVLFGAPIAKPDDTLRAVYTAFRLQDKFSLLRRHIEVPVGHDLGLGISIATGEAVVGNFGSSHRMEYTAIGEVVNLAARLEKFADHGEIVIDEATFRQLPSDRFRFTIEKNVKVKGTVDQTIYRLSEILIPQKDSETSVP